MKTFLHYLNWALHDFNHVVLNVLLKPYVRMLLLGALFIGIALGPAFIPGITINLVTIWASFVIIVSPFVVITWMVKHEKPETEEVTDQFGMTHTITEEFESKNWKQSALSGAKWFLYIVFLLVSAAIIVSIL